MHAPRFYQPSATDRDKCKAWLEVEKEGNANYYRPAVDEGQALEQEIRRFLDHVVGPENREVLQKVLAELTSRERQGK